MSSCYVCNTTDGTVVEVDLTSFTVVNTVSVPGAYDIVTDAAYAFAYVTCTAGVVQIDLSTFTVINTVSALNQAIAIDPTDNYLYVGAVLNDDVEKVDISSFTVVDTLAASTFPEYVCGLAVDIYNQYLYVLAGDASTSASVLKVDISSFTVVDTLPIGGAAGNPEPGGIIVDHANSYAYAMPDNFGGGAMSQIDLGSFTVVATAGGYILGGLAINSTDDKLYVASYNSSEIDEYVAGASFGFAASLPMGVNIPWRIDIDTADHYAYVTLNTKNELAKIDISGSLSLVGTLAIGNGPYGISARPHGTPPSGGTKQIMVM